MQPSQYTSAPGPQQSYRSQYTTVASGPQFTPLAPGPQQGYGQSLPHDPQYHLPNQHHQYSPPDQQYGYVPGSRSSQPTYHAPHPHGPNHHYGYHNGDIQSCLSHTQSHPHLTGTSDQHQQAPLLSYINTRTNKSPHSLPPNISSSIAGSHDMGTATSRVPLTQSNAPAARDHDPAPGNLDPALNDLAPPLGDSASVLGDRVPGLASDTARPQETTTRDSLPPLLNFEPPHPTSPVIAPTGVPLTAAAKKMLTPDDVMEGFKLKTLAELRDLQHSHIRYKKLNLAIKIEAQDLFFEYQRKQYLLSLKHSRPFKCLTKYLGQRRTRQKESNWHSFQKTNPLAQKALHNTEDNIGERNKKVGQIYRQQNAVTADRAPAPANTPATFNSNTDPDAAERARFGKIFKSDAAIRKEVKLWAEGVQLKLKELSDSFGVEGFLVLAAQDHRKPLFFQGGSLLGDEYLRALIADTNPMRKFAVWAAGSKGVSQKRKRNDPDPATNVTDQPSNKKSKLSVAAFANRDVCQGTLAHNHKYIAEELGKMFRVAQSKSRLEGKRSSWPGTDTVLRLARVDHKIVVHANTTGLSVEHLIDSPVKKMPIEVTWLVLRGLKNKWIELVEHDFNVLPQSTTVRKRQVASIEEEDVDDDNNNDNNGDDNDDDDDGDDDDDDGDGGDGHDGGLDGHNDDEDDEDEDEDEDE
ncbi:hypothetical protein MJO28_000172 [Puccinia striiformis f. sp. tritici]|uniref:Uncharacterized protein n=1 Tax=Puccinia striiformis f. sp. tritici TaxID=168172 RepID=A0ACC0F065_9BASI|nr:hypothetical protein MJO28_000172 [Puccinia striiformis f. sp. tritici]